MSTTFQCTAELQQIVDAIGSVDDDIKAAVADGKLELMEIVPIVLKVVRAVEAVASDSKGALKLELAQMALTRILQESPLKGQPQLLVAMRFVDTHVPFIVASAVQANKLTKPVRKYLNCCWSL